MEKVFERIKRVCIDVEEDLIICVRSLFQHTENYVRVRNQELRKFYKQNGYKKLCIYSPLLFNLVFGEGI